MRRRSLLSLLVVAIGLLAIPASSQAYLTGVADENPGMFTSAYYQNLITRQPASQRISRYIVAYDVADGNRANTYFLNVFRLWYARALSSRVTPLVAFYHSEIPSRAVKMPSVGTYTRDVKAFLKLFPRIKQYQPWNEANRGYIPRTLQSPNALQAAQYYKALRGVCRGCQIAALDVLDAANIRPTLNYIAQFRHDLSRMHVPTPRLWGLHNYSDTNRFSRSRTKAILGAVPGQVWLTETGGIVNFGRSFPNRNGSGDTRAAKALSFMFGLAGSNSRITRLYIFDWSGANADARFDAGLLDAAGTPRPGYVVVCKKLHASKCSGFPIDTKH